MEDLRKKTMETREKLRQLEGDLIGRLKVDLAAPPSSDAVPPPSPIASIDFNPLFRQIYMGNALMEEEEGSPREAESDRSIDRKATVSSMSKSRWSQMQAEKELEDLRDRILELERENQSLKKMLESRKHVVSATSAPTSDKTGNETTESSVKTLEVENQDLVERLVNVKVELADKNDMLSHALRQAAVNEQTIVAKKLEIAHLKGQSEDLAAQVSHLKKEIVASKNVAWGLREQLTAMKKSFEKLSKEKARLESAMPKDDKKTRGSFMGNFFANSRRAATGEENTTASGVDV